MAHPYHHALSSVKKWGGTVDDYQPVPCLVRLLKSPFCGLSPQSHVSSFGRSMAFRDVFGPTITLSTGRIIPTRWVGEQHVGEDLGFIPSFTDWVKAIRPETLDGPHGENRGAGRSASGAAGRGGPMT